MRQGTNTPTESSSLELLASIQAVAELEQTDIVLADLVNEMLRSIDLPERELVVVLVVKDVH